MKPKSIIARLTGGFAAATALVFLTAGLAIFLFQSVELRRHQTEELKARIQVIEAMVYRADGVRGWRFISEKLSDFTPADGSLRFQVDSQDPGFRYGLPWSADAKIQSEGDGVFVVNDHGRRYLGIDALVPARGARPTVRVSIASDLANVRATTLVMGIGVLIVTLVAVIIVALLARLIARRGLGPLDELSRHAQALNPKDLGLRLPLSDLPAELKGMTGALNGALDRIEDAYARLATFNADVAHELRTPLGNLIGQTQVALSRPRASGELQAILQSNLEEFERLRSLVNDMLFLARADEGTMAENLTTISLASLIRKTADFLDVLFEDANASLVIEGDAKAAVEPALIGRAITNLIDNALRHGLAGGLIRVGVDDLGALVRLSVRNRGEPIPQPSLERLFDRFYRMDPARAGRGESHGLGLAIVKAVAVMHGGSVFARCEEGEVVIGLELPKAHGGSSSPDDRHGTGVR